ncbi:hypothetical protein ACE83Q_02640 [Dellaglioa sp. P0083]|uniref:hypothetical protein n=1 Tax=Dellaglioa kimchii TaxID=3344667 RepID=UPI0038D4C548
MTKINITNNLFGSSSQFKSPHSIVQFNIDSQLNEQPDALFLSYFSIDIHEKILESDMMQKLPIYLSKEAFELKQQFALLGKISETHLNYKIIPINTALTIGDFTVIAFLSDSIYTGSLAFLVEDEMQKQAFLAGDTRLAGPHKKRTKKWIHDLNRLPLDVLILNTVNMIDTNYYTEITVLDHLIKLLKVEELTAVNVANENLYLIHKLATMAKKLDKIIALDKTTYQLLTYFYPDTEVISLNEDTSVSIKRHPEKYILVNIENELGDFNLSTQNTYSLTDLLENNNNSLPINSHLSSLEVPELLNRLTHKPKKLILIDPNFDNTIVTY